MAAFAGDIRTHVAPDEMGSNLVENGVHVADLHDAILQFLGINHERLTCPVSGLKFKLARVDPARVIKALLRYSTLALPRSHNISNLYNVLPNP